MPMAMRRTLGILNIFAFLLPYLDRIEVLGSHLSKFVIN